jgi:putative spermidine/putrescine transport system substrate-binding protein
MQGGLLWGPFTQHLPNMKRYYDLKASDIHYDMGIPIEGHEAIWGRAQLVFTYDAALVSDPPKSFAQLMEWVRQNPGQFTYPRLPDDFVGAAFIRTAYYELTGQGERFGQEMEWEEFVTLSEPVMRYFQALKPYLWRQGRAYPATQAQLDELFKSGEVLMTMGFEVGKSAGMIARGEYPETVRTFVFDTGTIGNAHYLAIPYNAPNKAAAMLTINFLQSPEAQIEKLKPEVWGDMPALDGNRLDVNMRTALHAAEAAPAFLPSETLAARRLPEMHAVYLDWIKELWVSEIGGR